MNVKYLTWLILFAVILLSGCRDRPMAMGSANAIMVGTPAERWTQIRDIVEEGLEPRVLTTRDERKFVVTHADPWHERWPRLREFRRVVLIGTREDGFMAQAVQQIPDEITAPVVVEINDVWARGQQVIVILIPSEAEAEESLQGLLPEALDLIHADFERYVARRMYASGVDDEVLARMRQATGGVLRVPAVYNDSIPDDRTFLAWNDHPDPTELIRSVLIRYVDGHREPSVPAALEWRTEIGAEAYPFRQDTETDRIETQSVTTNQYEGVEIQGVWVFPPGEWPGAGSFTSRMVYCGDLDRTYLLDAWLYAPARDKYEYQLQLRNILNSFQCG